MNYSRINDVDTKKIAPTGAFYLSEGTRIANELAAIIIEQASADTGKPKHMSEDALADLLDQISQIDDTVPNVGLGKIATFGDAGDEPEARESQSFEALPAAPSPVCTINTPSTPTRTVRKTYTPKPQTYASSWKHATEHHKFNEGCRAAEDLGGFTFSLDLSARIERTLWTHNDPCRLLSTYINKALKSQGISGTPYTFALEYAPLQADHKGRMRSKLHLHGAVISDEPDKVQAALKVAGGRITGKSASTQIKLKPFDGKRGGGNGWAVYALKDEDRTWRNINGDRVMFINDPLRRIVQQRWNERRPVKRRQRKPPQ